MHVFSPFPTHPFSFPPLTRLVCFFLSPHVLHCFPPNYRLACTSRATPLPSPFNFSPKNTQPLGYLNKKKQTQQRGTKKTVCKNAARISNTPKHIVKNIIKSIPKSKPLSSTCSRTKVFSYAFIFFFCFVSRPVGAQAFCRKEGIQDFSGEDG